MLYLSLACNKNMCNQCINAQQLARLRTTKKAAFSFEFLIAHLHITEAHN